MPQSHFISLWCIKKTLRKLLEISFLHIHYFCNISNIKFDHPLRSLCKFLAIYTEFAVSDDILRYIFFEME